jgi:hypothetical protein
MLNIDKKQRQTGRRVRTNGTLVKLTIVLLLSGFSSFVGAQGDVTIIIDSGVGPGSADTAWGTFDTDGPPFEVCSRIDRDVFPPGMTEFELVNGMTRVTSSGLPDGGGLFGLNLRDGIPGGPPDQILHEVDFAPPGVVASFPQTTELVLPGSSGPVPFPPKGDVFLCLATNEERVHIPGFNKTGRAVYVSENSGVFQRNEGVEVPFMIEILIENPDVPGTTLITEIAGFGPGVGTTWFDTEYLSLHVHAGIRIDFLVDDEVVASDEVGPGEMASGIIGESGLGGTSLWGQAGFTVWFNKKFTATEDEGFFGQEIIFATLPDGRQFGQFFAAKPKEDAQQAGETSLLFTTHDPSRYRVNVGLSSVADGTEVALTPLSAADGSPAGNTVTMQLDDAGTKQWNDIYSRWNLGDDGDVMIEVEVVSGAVFPYASILDGRGSVAGTSDPTTIMPVFGGSQSVVLLEVGRITGLNEFSGSASLHNHSTRNLVIRVDFHERGVPGISDSQTGEIGPGQTLSWDDAVGELVGRTGAVGALVFTVEGGGPVGSLSGIGREFAIFSEGGEITGTAGQLMPGLTPAGQLAVGETFHFLGLRDRNLPEGRERSHLGVLNLGQDSVMMTVDGYDDQGGLEGTITKTVRAGEQLRVNNVLKAINSSVDGGLKRLEVTADGPLYILAYRVNATGDPVTLQPFREVGQ